MNKYKTNERTRKLEKVDIDSETPSSVVIGGKYFSKRYHHITYHDTFEKAKQHMVDYFCSKLKDARLVAKYAQNNLAEAMNLEDKT